MPNRTPQLVQEMLRQADVDPGNQHVSAQRLKLANPRAQLFLILLVRHNFAS